MKTVLEQIPCGLGDWEPEFVFSLFVPDDEFTPPHCANNECGVVFVTERDAEAVRSLSRERFGEEWTGPVRETLRDAMESARFEGNRALALYDRFGEIKRWVL